MIETANAAAASKVGTLTNKAEENTTALLKAINTGDNTTAMTLLTENQKIQRNIGTLKDSINANGDVQKAGTSKN
jgi:hypothetical protein